MPSFESQSSSISTSTSCSSSHSDSADTRDASDYERAKVVEDDDDDTLKLKTPDTTDTPRTYTHSVGFPRYEDLFYRPPPRTSSRAYLGLGLRRRNRDARVLVSPASAYTSNCLHPHNHTGKLEHECDYDCGLGYGYGKNDDGYEYAYARYDPRASPGVDEQLRELMYEMRDWVVENPEEASKRLQVCLRLFVSPCSYFLFSLFFLFCLIVSLLPSNFFAPHRFFLLQFGSMAAHYIIFMFFSNLFYFN